MTATCLLLVIGPPAAGKSSLCRQLAKTWTHRCDVTHVEYDVICESDDSPCESAGSLTSWRERRRVALAQVATCLSRASDERDVVVLVDDTMHLRSMRYKCFQLARRKAAGFGQVYVRQDLSSCLRSNATGRNRRRLADSVVRGVFSRFEPPTGRWEANSVEVTLTDCQNCPEVVEIVGQLLARTLAEDPPAPPIDLSFAADESRRVCSTNERHQLDCALRRLVGEHVSGRADRAKSANQARRNVMSGVVNGSIRLPTDFQPGCLDLTAHDLFFTELSLIECMNK